MLESCPKKKKKKKNSSHLEHLRKEKLTKPLKMVITFCWECLNFTFRWDSALSVCAILNWEMFESISTDDGFKSF